MAAEPPYQFIVSYKSAHSGLASSISENFHALRHRLTRFSCAIASSIRSNACDAHTSPASCFSRTVIEPRASRCA